MVCADKVRIISETWHFPSIQKTFLSCGIFYQLTKIFHLSRKTNTLNKLSVNLTISISIYLVVASRFHRYSLRIERRWFSE